MYTLRVYNDQGASDETRNLETSQDVRDQIDTWADPENMTAKVIDSETGSEVYSGPASAYAARA